MSSAGKIARLSSALREDLNHRLRQNIPAAEILPWLNSLPEVQVLLRTYFDGAPVNPQNLSNWRRTGFLEWQNRADFLAGLRDIARDAAAVESSLGSLTDHVARLLALHFSEVLCPRQAVYGDSVPSKPGLSENTVKLLCRISHAIASLRRGDHAAARLRHQQENDAQLQRREKQRLHQNQILDQGSPPGPLPSPSEPPARPAPFITSNPAAIPHQAQSSQFNLPLLPPFFRSLPPLFPLPPESPPVGPAVVDRLRTKY